MTRLASLIASSALALSAGAAQAQITADDAWAAIIAQYAAMGAVIEGSQTRDGNTLRVAGIAGRYDLPEGLGTLRLTVGDVVLTENGDGSVSAAMAAAYPLAISLDLVAEGEAFGLGLDFAVQSRGQTAVITGTPDEVIIDGRTGRFEMTLTGITLPPEMGSEAFDIDVYILLEGLANQTRILTGERLSVRHAGSIDRTVTDVSFVAGDVVSQSVSLTEDTTYAGFIDFPAAPVDLARLAAALRGGLALEFGGSNGTTVSQSVTRFGGAVVSSQGQRLDRLEQRLELSADGVATTANFAGLEVDFALSDHWPAPLRATMEGGSFALAMPLLASETPSPARFAISIRALEIDDFFWEELLGPGVSAINGPLDFSADLSATMRWRSEVLDFDTLVAAVDSGDIVAELATVSLDSLNGRFGGAAVTGSGAATLDWAGVTRMYQLEEPTGQARYVLTGVNALLEQLSGLGLIAPDEMMAARAFLTMAGRPTGPDELSGSVEFSPDGGLVVNGVRID